MRKKIALKNAIQMYGDKILRIFLWQLWHRAVQSLKFISARL